MTQTFSPDATYSERLSLECPPRVQDFATKSDIRLIHLLVIALLEHGRPLSMHEIASRLLSAGIKAPSGNMVYSLTKAWHGLPPIQREPDGRMGLDLWSSEMTRILARFGLQQPRPAPSLPPVPILTVPDDTVPVTFIEIEAAIQHPSFMYISDERLVGAVLEASRTTLSLEEVNQYICKISGNKRPPLKPRPLRSPWRHALVKDETDNRFTLLDETDELVNMRRAIRTYAYKILQRQADEGRSRQLSRAYGASRVLIKAQQAAEFSTLRRAVIRCFPAMGKPAAMSILDIGQHTIRTIVGGDTTAMIAFLSGFGCLIGLNPGETIMSLEQQRDRWILVNLHSHPKSRRINKRGKTLHLSTDMLISHSVGISRPLYDEQRMHGYLAAGDIGKLTRRLESDVKALYSFYRYGCLHGCVRLRWGFLDDVLRVEWALPGEDGLYDIIQDALSKKREVDVILGSAPGWADPWSRAVRGYVSSIECGGLALDVNGSPFQVDRCEIQAIRLAEEPYGNSSSSPSGREGRRVHGNT